MTPDYSCDESGLGQGWRIVCPYTSDSVFRDGSGGSQLPQIAATGGPKTGAGLTWPTYARMFLLLDFKLAVHLYRMAGKGAEKSVVALPVQIREIKSNACALATANDPGMRHHAVIFG